MCVENDVETDRMTAVAIVGIIHEFCHALTIKLNQPRTPSAVLSQNAHNTHEGIGMQPLISGLWGPDCGYGWEDSVFDGRITWHSSQGFKCELILFRYCQTKFAGWKTCDCVYVSDDCVRRILGMCTLISLAVP